MIVDAHHHFLSAALRYDFTDFMPELPASLGPGDLDPLREAAGVDETIVVQADNSTAESIDLLATATETSWVRGVVGWVDLLEPHAVGANLDELISCGPLVGVRHMLHFEPDDWVLQPEVVASLHELAARDLVFDFGAMGTHHLVHLPALLDAVPELRVVICHYGFPRVGEEWEPWAEAIAAVAGAPRVALKASGLDMVTDAMVGTTGPTVDTSAQLPYFRHCLEVLGPTRIMWASNWPVSLRGSGYGVLLDTMLTLLEKAEVPAEDRHEILGGTARRVYRLT